jgi:hypothetical protein
MKIYFFHNPLYVKHLPQLFSVYFGRWNHSRWRPQERAIERRSRIGVLVHSPRPAPVTAQQWPLERDFQTSFFHTVPAESRFNLSYCLVVVIRVLPFVVKIICPMSDELAR